ncbi:MAG: hypothetical protein M1821_002961 [Bathelium mastoideum]|nr:MAG: hypothetical protein M1821_002961 [Bathelium mastoideum]KAI9694397.1 MAG: hypothetical protein M1822_000013 [Bathelium mastoideum]
MDPSSTTTEIPLLSFGIELEGVIAFHENVIRDHLMRHRPGYRLVKEVSEKLEPSLRSPRYKQIRYNSWALEKHSGKPLPYSEEPLYIARSLVCSNAEAPDINIHSGDNKLAKFKSWYLSPEPNVPGIARLQLQNTFARCIGAMNEDCWDSWGMEIISPPYRANQIPSFQKDFMALTNSLQNGNTKNCSSFAGFKATDSCGLHVHIGLPDGSEWPVTVVKHLAYLTLVYEDTINALLHPCRRSGDHVNAELKSNRENIYTAGCEDDPFELPDGRRVRGNYRALSRVRADIYGAQDTFGGRTALEKIVSLLSPNRGYRIAFRPLLRPEASGRARTVEFRQYAGTLDHAEVRSWVEFCLKLVRLAWRYADEGKQEGGCLVQNWMDPINIEDLWEEMGMSEEEKRSWRERRNRYADIARDWEPDPLWEECNEDEPESW